jgi:uncharacterized protein with HEPN domain
MPGGRPLARLNHVLDAILAIERYTLGKSFENYRYDPMRRDAVERNLERLSEASRHIPAALKDAYPGIDWRAIAAMGNVLRHDSERVLDRRVWQILADELSTLKAAVEGMIAKIGNERDD